jgi:hypothetical protein
MLSVCQPVAGTCNVKIPTFIFYAMIMIADELRRIKKKMTFPPEALFVLDYLFDSQVYMYMLLCTRWNSLSFQYFFVCNTIIPKKSELFHFSSLFSLLATFVFARCRLLFHHQ